MTKVLLIKAPGFVSFPFPRLGLACLAAELIENNISCDIIDCDALHYRYLKDEKHLQFNSQTRNIDHPINWEYIREKIPRDDYGVIGISCIFTADIKNTFLLAALLREIYPDALIVGGGHHMDAEAINILQYTENFDCIVHGEGEEVLLDVVKKYTGSAKRTDLSNISGLSYKVHATGDIIPGFARPLNKNIDSRPLPAREKLPLREYNEYFNEIDFRWGVSEKDSPCGLLITSRGCPYKCAYCSAAYFWGRSTCLRSAESLLTEIESLIEQYGVSHFSIVDSTFILSKPRILEFCEKKIKKNLKFTWLCNGRVNLIDEELVHAMKNAGCTTIGFGVETGSDEIAATMGKNSSIDLVRRAIKITRSAGILPMCYFMIGYIGETPETLRQTEQFMKELLFEYGAYVDSPFIATPFPGTDFYETIKKAGKVRTFDYSKYWLGKRHRSPDRLPHVPDAFTEEEIKKESSRIHKQLDAWRREVKLDFPMGA